MIRFKGHSDGKVIVPDEPVDLPKDQPLNVVVETEEVSVETKSANEEEPEKGLPLLDLALEIAEKFRGLLPEDLAENHDHYIHGKPKR